LVRAVRPQVGFVLVVDDGSTDGTANLAAGAGAIVIRRERNCGKGAALQAGLADALARGCEWAVTLDGDGQHAPADLPALFQAAKLTGAALVVGDRMRNKNQMPWLRRNVNRWMSRQLSLRAGQRLPDTQSGFRVIHLPTWAGMALRAERFEVESETLLAFVAAGCPVEFVPVQVLPGARRSHIRPVADSIRWLRWWRGTARLPGAGGARRSGSATLTRTNAPAEAL
jgi:hypothetical protein